MTMIPQNNNNENPQPSILRGILIILAILAIAGLLVYMTFNGLAP